MSTKLAKKEKEEVAVAELPKLVISAEDIEIPKLNVIQKQSNIEGNPGSLMLEQTHEIVGKDEEVSVTVVNAVKRWREDIDFDLDEMPRYADTEEERAALQADSQWSVIEISDIVLLFEKPEGGNDTVFPYPIGDSQFALGKLNVQKDGYRCTYKRLATYAAFNPTQPLASLKWNFKCELLTRGKYSWFVPSLTVSSEEPSGQVVDFISKIWTTS